MKFPQVDMKKYLVAHLIMVFAFVLTLSSFGIAQKSSGSDVVMAPLSDTLVQCANGKRGDPELPCAGGNWQGGNLNRNNSQWVEGEFVPFRAIITALTPGSTTNTLTITYETTNSGKHAIDYLGTWDQSTVAPNGPGGANACGVISPCTPGTGALIPVDPNLAANSNPDVLMPSTGMFQIWNGNITAVSAYTVSGTYAGTSSTSITLTYTANDDTVVVAWGGHVSTRVDWTIGGSAVNISGSSYHMSINGGPNRSMSVDAAIFPAFLIIIKEVTTLGAPPGSTATFSFNYTFTQGTTTTPFSLVDDVVGTGGGGTTIPTLSPNATEVFPLTSFLAANTITVTEANYAPTWTLSGAPTCVEDPGGLPQVDNSTGNAALRNVTVIAEEGEVITCTFRNTQFAPTAAPANVSGRAVDSFGNGIGGARISVMNAQTGQVYSAITNPFGYYTVLGTEIEAFYVMTISHKRYVFADDTRAFTLVDNLTGVDFIANP